MMRQGGPNKNQNQRGRSGGNRNGGGGYQGGGQQRRPGNGSPNRMASFDSNGPDVRIRGNAYQVHEKYVALARDASVAGDRVLVESYYQHAEHYYRIINAENYGPNGERRQDAYQRSPDNGQDAQDGDFQDGEGQAEGGEQGYREERPEGYRENRPDQRPDQRQERGEPRENGRGNRQEGNFRRERQQGEQPERQFAERQYQERQNLAELPQPDLPIVGAVTDLGDENQQAPSMNDAEQAPPEATVERRRRHPRQVQPDDLPQDRDEQPEV